MKSNNLKPCLSNGNKLIIDEMFYSLQTEGVFAGRPAYFIRLFGCNLNCSFCDTPQKKGKKMSVKKILKTVTRSHPGHLVVITGGEPFLQNIWPLCEGLIRMGFYIQIETNGSVKPQGKFVWVPKSVYAVVSPKNRTVQPDIAAVALAFKYVVSVGNVGKDGLPKGVYKDNNKARIMLSPCFTDSKKETRANIAYTVDLCKQYGYYFSLQYHKLIGIK